MKPPCLASFLGACPLHLLLACLVVGTAFLHGQIQGGTLVPGTTLAETWLDPKSQILGDVANGPRLQPKDESGPRASSPPPWGPRGYVALGKLPNFSVRGLVSNEQPLLAGFTVAEGDRIVLIRAIGPTLATFGVRGTLSRPQLTLRDARGVTIAQAVAWSSTNYDVREELKKAAVAVGAFALLEGSEDQVLLLVVKSGAYSCEISGGSATPGAVLLEIYDIPSLVPPLLPPPPGFGPPSS